MGSLCFNYNTILCQWIDFILDGNTITLYTGTETGNLLIPSNIDNIPIENVLNTTFITNNDFTSVLVPSSVSNIGNNTFGECSNLFSINVEDENPYYLSENGILYNKDKTSNNFSTSKRRH